MMRRIVATLGQVRRRLLLWDIDGTLIRAGDLGFEVFHLAVEAVIGRRPAFRVQTAGKTDPHIAREYLRQMGVPETDETVVAI